MESQYINISTYRPLSGVKLPAELKSFKNNDQKCFLWCHIRHTNPVKMHPERITRENKKLANNLNYGGVGFPLRENFLGRLKKKRTIFALTSML